MSFKLHQKRHNFSEMGSEITHFREKDSELDTFQEKDSEMGSDCFFLLGKRAREGGCPGASGLGNRFAFETGGTPFFEVVFRSNFFTQSCDF